MLELNQRRTALGLMVAFIASCLPLAAQAATINIILSDMDVVYSGEASGNTGSLYDIIAQPGGDRDPTESDELETAVFELDLTPVGTLMTSAADGMYGDLRVDGVGSSLALGTFHTDIGSNGGGFGFEWFTESGNYLRLGIDTINMRVTNNTFFFEGTATVLEQNLPFALVFDTPQEVAFSYTATLPSLPGGNPQTVNMAMASGAMTISGTGFIPEPTSGLMALMGTALAAVGLRRRRLVL